MSTGYVPLWVKSNYSFLEGASHPDELVEEAHRVGVNTLALTDRDGVYGMVRAHVAAREHGIKVIVGAEVTVFDDTVVLLLAQTRCGYGNLCRLLSKGRLRSAKGESRVEWEEVCHFAKDLVAVLPFGKSVLAKDDHRPVVGDLCCAFGDRLYLMVARHKETHERALERELRRRADDFRIPVVAGVEVLYHTRQRRDLQDVMTCIRHGMTLATAGRRIQANAEHALHAPEPFRRLFADDPYAVHRTLEVGARCTFSLHEIRYRYPSEKLPDGTDSASWLRELTYRGAAKRYPDGVPADVTLQVERELAVIHDLEYDGYFLTMYEIVRFCREQKILCQGRGSAANSAVCFCLGITAIDPVRMGLLFERFLSKERAEPPDIDLDIEHDRREEVIQHVYTEYGRTHAAMVCNFIRYRARSAVREVGKVLGMAETDVDRFARFLSHYGSVAVDSFEEAGLDPDNPLHENLLRLTQEIHDTPRHLSIHPGGFLLGHERVDELVPIENATMPERTVIQWDKDDLEDLGLFKVDLLGLGSLFAVHKSFDLIEKHCGETWSLATIPPEDEETFDMICEGDTVGVFQIESRAQMAMLPRLRPRTYYDLVIEVSIVRPGPIHGGMVHPYLRRRNGDEEVTYPHESLAPVLEKTLGIPLFQEQVMQIAVVAADYTPGEADQLRRDMAAWRKSGRMERHRERLISRMMRKGIAREFAERVFEQICGFGEYGFPESHAASFSLIAYATAWLKRHYPAAFVCALLNSQPMGFYSPATLVDDAKRHGIAMRPVDVRHSERDCTLETQEGSGEGFAVRMGLRYIKGVHDADIDRILAAHPFTTLDEFVARCGCGGGGLGEGTLARLAEAGALEGFEGRRRDALWDVLGRKKKEDGQLELAEYDPEAHFAPLNAMETVRWDYTYTSHSPRAHPLETMREELQRQKLPDAAAVRGMPDGRRVRYAGLVISRQRPGTAKGVVFMTLEDESGFVNVVLWEKVFTKFRVLAKTEPFLGVTGKLQVESGVTHLVAERLWVPKVRVRPEETKSRDFH